MELEKQDTTQDAGGRGRPQARFSRAAKTRFVALRTDYNSECGSRGQSCISLLGPRVLLTSSTQHKGDTVRKHPC